MHDVINPATEEVVATGSLDLVRIWSRPTPLIARAAAAGPRLAGGQPC
jgi:hypothetical protein